MKILYLCTDSSIGGAERMVLGLAAYFRKKGHSPEVITLKPEGELHNRLKDIGVYSYSLNIKNRFSPFAIPKLVRIIKEGEFDILHTHLRHANVLAYITGMFTKLPRFIYTAHSFIPLRISFLDRINLRAMREANHLIIAVSRGVKEDLIKRGRMDASHIKVIYNGLFDIEKASTGTIKRSAFSWNEDTTVIGVIANLRPVKGIECFLEGAKSVIEKIKTARFLIVGQGKLEKKLKALIKKKGLRDKVVLTGFQSDVSPYMRLMDIVVVPSLNEGFGLSILEAWAFKKPVVGSAVGGIVEIIDDEKNGLLFSVGSNLKLASAIIRLIEDPILAQRLGEAGKEKIVAHFQGDRMARETMETYLQ